MTREDDRLGALRDLEILDTAPEAEFDSLVKAASTACGTPLSFLSLVDAERVWHKAGVGSIGTTELPRASTFCHKAIVDDDILEVPDASLDPRFASLETVRAEDGLRFYAGAPIRLASGETVGTVCVLDRVPRRLEPAQREVLRCLALAAARGLEGRKARLAQQRIARSLQTTMSALAASHSQLRRYYEATPALLHSIDAEGRLLMVSDLWLKTFGHTRAEVIGRRSTDFLTEASRRKAIEEVLPAFFRDGRCDRVAYQMLAKDGTILDVLVSGVLERDLEGRILRSLTVIEDVTARLAAERAVRESEAGFRMLAETTGDVITRLDLDFVRRYASPACRDVLGYEPEELIGLTPSVTGHPDDAARVRAILEDLKAGRAEGDRATVTTRMRHKRGHWIWVEAGLGLARDPETNRPRYIVCALRDVTVRREMADEMERARIATEKAAQSKTEFVANMSHELRTPLTGILGVHELLLREPDLAPKHRRQLDLAHEAGQSLLAVINDVLDFSKIEAGELNLEAVSFDLPGLIEACCAFVQGEAAKKSLVIVTKLVGADVPLLGDPVRLRQVLLNLVSNAVKFTAEGQIRIAATFSPEANTLRLALSDTGIGIAAEQLPRVFERFRQADGSITRTHGGTGLGLAICKRLVELMGGAIGVTSTFGVGSTFTVELPMQAAEEAAGEATQPAPSVAARRAVLLVEDNPLNQAIIAEMLRQRGHIVTLMANGREAVDAAEGGALVRFDAILMDIQMPLLDGFSATRAIRDLELADRSPRTPIIGLTASATAEDEARCAEAGMDAHVTKPVEWPKLFAALDRLTDRAPSPPLLAPCEPAELVLDETTMDGLAGIIGRPRLTAMLRSFIDQVQVQAAGLTLLDETELAQLAHSWISMAGHLGFQELQECAAAIEADIREGRGGGRVGLFQKAAERAIEAALVVERGEAA